MKYIDLYGHYAWNIDKGVRNREEALRLLEIAHRHNITRIVATPELVPSKFELEDIYNAKGRMNELRLLAKRHHIRVYDGSIVILNRHTITVMDQRLFIPVGNSRYVLCALMPQDQYMDFHKEVALYLSSIINIEYKPIITNVNELCQSDEDLKWITSLAKAGCLLAISAESLVSKDRALKKRLYKLLDANLITLIASGVVDSSHQVDALSQACHQLAKRYEYQGIKDLFYDNPKLILHDEEVNHRLVIKQSLISKIRDII
ncbi:MAG: hypothetical protein J6P61_01835 [Erysipelotrichaceae bacterium]|nr:hypothetical protein [Erysipelotrichaceae bacterium]